MLKFYLETLLDEISVLTTKQQVIQHKVLYIHYVPFCTIIIIDLSPLILLFIHNNNPHIPDHVHMIMNMNTHVGVRVSSVYNIIPFIFVTLYNFGKPHCFDWLPAVVSSLATYHTYLWKCILYLI